MSLYTYSLLNHQSSQKKSQQSLSSSFFAHLIYMKLHSVIQGPTVVSTNTTHDSLPSHPSFVTSSVNHALWLRHFVTVNIENKLIINALLLLWVAVSDFRAEIRLFVCRSGQAIEARNNQQTTRLSDLHRHHHDHQQFLEPELFPY